MLSRYSRTATLVALLCLSSCERDQTVPTTAPETEAPAALVEAEVTAEMPPAAPDAAELLPEQAQDVWRPWIGDMDGIVERRVLRAVVPYGGYQYFYEGGRPRGAAIALLQRLEAFINERLGRTNVKVYVLAIPVSRDQLLSSLLNGNADLVAADLTVTEQRSAKVTFSRPLLDGVREVVVTGPAAPDLRSIDDLGGQEIFVRLSSSYAEHLDRLGNELQNKGIAAPLILAADELLEAEDILEMVNAGMIGATVMDDYKARFWAQVFPDIRIREDLVINDGGVIAWAIFGLSLRIAQAITPPSLMTRSSRIRQRHAGRKRHLQTISR